MIMSTFLVMIRYDDRLTNIIKRNEYFGNSVTMNNLCLEIGFLF